MVRVPGSWKSLDDLEENVTIVELERMLTASRKIEYERNKFAAALKGVNLDAAGKGEKSKFDEIQEQAIAESKGMDPEELELTSLGFTVE